MIEQFRSSLVLLGPGARLRMLQIGVLILLNSVLEVLGVGLIFSIIKLIDDPTLIHRVATLEFFYTGFGLDSEKTFLIFGIGFLLAAFLFKGLLFLVMVWFKFKFATDYEAAVSSDLFGLYLNGPFVDVGDRNSSELITNIANRVFSVVNTTVLGLITIVTDLLTILAITVFLLIVEPLITLITASVLFGAAVIGAGALRNTLQRMGREDVEYSQSFLKTLQESFDGLTEIKIFGRVKYFLRQFSETRRRQAILRRRQFTLQETPRVSIEFIVISGLLLTLLIIILQERSSGELLAALTLFGVAILRIMPASNRILFTINHIQSQKHNVQRVVADFSKLKSGTAQMGQESSAAVIEFRREIRLEDLSFSYPGSTDNALFGIDLSIAKGETVGIVGPSGAGKSTLATVIMGLYQPNSGHLVIDDRDVSASIGAWQKKIGYVPQRISLIDDTITKNVTFGAEYSPADQAHLESAINRSGVGKFAAEFPAGLDTVIGEDGARISGGQAQRIGIARALFSDPDVLVMDEATSALDLATEREIADAVQAMSGDKTIIIIAHRLSTVRNCDMLYFMDQGRLVDSGDFDELSRRNASFRELVRLMQAGPPMPEPELAAVGEAGS